MADTTAAKVKEIIINELGVDPEKVTPEASFVDDLGADSRSSNKKKFAVTIGSPSLVSTRPMKPCEAQVWWARRKESPPNASV
jgi:hypothetical protein